MFLAWDTFQKCYLNEECGKACIRAYHNHYTPSCMDSKANPTEGLTCADYGQIHYGGAGSCGDPTLAATEFIDNMTLLCGCESE